MKPLNVCWLMLAVAVGLAVLLNYAYPPEALQEFLEPNLEPNPVVVDFSISNVEYSWDFTVTYITGGVQYALDSGVYMEWATGSATYTTDEPFTSCYIRTPGHHEMTLTLYRYGEPVSESLTRAFWVGDSSDPPEEILPLWD